jgi:hypothetical protein
MRITAIAVFVMASSEILARKRLEKTARLLGKTVGTPIHNLLHKSSTSNFVRFLILHSALLGRFVNELVEKSIEENNVESDRFMCQCHSGDHFFLEEISNSVESDRYH